MDKIKPIDLSLLKTYPLASRKSKVDRKDFARAWKPQGSLKDFLEQIPNILAAKDFKSVVSAIAAAHKGGKNVVAAMGAHVIKAGLNPIVIDMMERGIITAVAMNGAGIVHDLELAMIGRTSEEVLEGLEHGAFGMAQETADFLNRAMSKAGMEDLGLGQAVGQVIIEEDLAGDHRRGPSFWQGEHLCSRCPARHSCYRPCRDWDGHNSHTSRI
jgi:hypothetical protein